MTQHNEKGTQRDLVLYRLEAAKSDIKSAKILLEAGECRRANFSLEFPKKKGKKA